MKFRWDNRYLHWGVTAFLVIAASMLFYYGIFHMKTLIVGIKTFLGIMAPIIYGVILAYILSPLINLFEQKLIYPQLEKHNIKLQKKGKRAIRWGCVIFSMFLFWIIIYALLMMVLPQLIRSIMSIIYSFPYYIKVIEKWLNSFVEHGWKLNPEMLDMINQYSVKAQEYLTTDILPQMQDMLKNVSAGIFDILIFMKNFLIGAIVALYVLADKEKFVAKSKFCYYWSFVLFWNVAFGFAVSNSYQCNYRCDKCHSVFWSLHRSHSMYFAYFSSRSYKRSVFCNFYPASSAV